MGERVVRNDEVRGSIPLGSTSPDALAIAPRTACKRRFSALPVLTAIKAAALQFSKSTIFGTP